MGQSSQRKRREQYGIDSAGDVHEPGFGVYAAAGGVTIDIKGVTANRDGNINVGWVEGANALETFDYAFSAAATAGAIATGLALVLTASPNATASAGGTLITIVPTTSLAGLTATMQEA
jgi:hypothetical protein